MTPLNRATARSSISLALLALIASIICGIAYAGEDLRPGSRYKIVGPVYLSGIFLDLNNRQLNRPLAVGDLTAVRFSGPEVAFQHVVPVGTVMTVIGSAPKRVPLPFYANIYFVRLEPDLSRGLDIELEINRGIEGSLDGLNPELFRKP